MLLMRRFAGSVCAVVVLFMLSAKAEQVESHGPFRYSCKDGTAFSITFNNQGDTYTARISVNGRPAETLTLEPTGSSSVYSGSRWHYYEWRDTTTLTDLSQRPRVEKSCHKIGGPVPPRGAGIAQTRPPTALETTAKPTQIAQPKSASTSEVSIPAPHKPDITQTKFYEFDGNGVNATCECGEGVCPIVRQGMMGFLDRNGVQTMRNELFKAWSGTCPVFREGLMLLMVGTNKGTDRLAFIDKNAKVQFWVDDGVTNPPPFKDGITIFERYVDFKLAAHLVDRQGNETRVEYVDGLPLLLRDGYREGLAVAGIRNGAAYVDPKGKVAFVVRGIKSAENFSDGFAWVQSNPDGDYAKWGAIDMKGNLVIPYTYTEQPKDFSEGLAAVRDRSGKWGFIDKTNAIRIPVKYDDVESTFRDGTAIVIEANRSKTLLIDKNGAIVKDIGGGMMCNRRDGLCWLWKGNAGGLADRKGNVLISDKYFGSSIGLFMDGLDGLAWATATIDGRRVEGYINIHGDFVVAKGQSQF